MRTTLGIPTYNGGERVGWLLESVRLRPPWPDDIVVVDDGSPRVQDTRVAVARAAASGLPARLVEHGRNRGISAGWNTAAKAATSVDDRIVVLANDDVVVSSGWLGALVHVLEHSPGVGVVGQSWHAFLREDVPALLAGEGSDAGIVPRDPATKAPDPRRPLSPPADGAMEDTNPGRVMAPTGQLFAFRRRDFDEIGGFDEGYQSFYEESDFGTAMAARLGKIGVQTTWPFCWHMWSATFAASPELDAGGRLARSREHYRRKWAVPAGVHEFDHCNPLHLGAIGDVEVSFLRRGGPARGVLRRDGVFIERPGV